MKALKCHTFRIVVLLELFLPLMRLTAPASDDKPYKTIKLYVSAISTRQLFELTAYNVLKLDISQFRSSMKNRSKLCKDSLPDVHFRLYFCHRRDQTSLRRENFARLINTTLARRLFLAVRSSSWKHHVYLRCMQFYSKLHILCDS